MIALFAQPSAAQRARFPTMIQATSQTPATTAPTTTAPPTTAPLGAAPATAQPGWTAAGNGTTGTAQPYPGVAPLQPAPSTLPPPAGAYGSGAAQPVFTQPTTPAPTPSTVGPPATGTPTYTPPNSGAPTFGPQMYGAAPMATPGPSATFNGTILPPPSWDPYATPGMQQPSLLPQDPYIQTPPSLAYPTTAGMTRFLQEVRLDYTWMDGKTDKPNHFSYNDVELTASFALPFLYSQQNPLIVTPGFDFYFLDGPADPAAEMPPRVYDAFVDTEWNPQITPWFGGELGFRVGIYSDFQKWNDRALRFTGHGLAALTLSPSFKIKAGIVYLDRVRVKMFPAGGIVWTPNQDWRFDILFPNPRISRRMWTTGVSDWWLYARGEYGGDSWVEGRSLPGPPVTFIDDQVDYNDIRVALGVERLRRGGGNFLFEVGMAFERELRFRSSRDNPYNLPNTFFLRAGLAF
jgi:hypothetical protein